MIFSLLNLPFYDFLRLHNVNSYLLPNFDCLYLQLVCFFFSVKDMKMKMNVKGQAMQCSELRQFFIGSAWSSPRDSTFSQEIPANMSRDIADDDFSTLVPATLCDSQSSVLIALARHGSQAFYGENQFMKVTFLSISDS